MPYRKSIDRWSLRAIGRGILALLAGLAPHCSALAADYPNRAITIIVPVAAGSGIDVRARQIGAQLSSRLGQPVVVDNRPGASGVNGASLVAKAKPDGYTLLACNGGTHGINSALQPQLAYDAQRDFSPVVRWVRVPMVLVVNPGLPYKSVADLVRAARANPGGIRFSSAGNASATQLASEIFAHQAGIKLTQIPYKGDGPAMSDVVAGHVDMMFAPPLIALPQVRGARVRALAINGAQRITALPDTPTLKESGIQGAEHLAWAGLCAPAHTPIAIVRRLNQESMAILMMPESKAEWERQGYEIGPNSPEEFSAFIDADISRLKKLVRDLNIQADQ